MRNILFVSTLLFFSAVPLCADIVLISPVSDEIVERVPENQKKIMSFATRKERLEALKSDRKAKKDYFSSKAAWRKSKGVIFKWKITANEPGPYKVTVSPNEDFSSPCHTFFADHSSKGTYRTTARSWGLDGNFEAAKKYFWRVTAYDFKNNKKKYLKGVLRN